MRKGFLATVVLMLPGLVLADQPGPQKLPAPAQPTVLGPGCIEACATGDEACGPPGRFWASAEFLYWWTKDQLVPPLVTANAGAPLATLGAAGTTVLFGGKDLAEDAHPGGRFTAGMWLNDCHTLGVEGSYFFLGSRSNSFIAGNGGSPTLSRPFVDVLTGLQSAEAVTSPGVVSGTVRVNSTTRLQGAEGNLIGNIHCCCNSRLDWIAGFRYIELNEGIGVREDLTILPGNPIPAGTTFVVQDQFDTRNRFYGGQIGLRGERWMGRWFANATTKIAFGETHEVVDVNGSTTITTPGAAPSIQRGGLLAQGTNIGSFSHDEFAVAPELNLNIGYQLGDHIRVFGGYTFLYLSNVVRPGDQIDLGVNTSQLPALPAPGSLVGPARPALSLRDTDFWAHGLNLGVEFRY